MKLSLKDMYYLKALLKLEKRIYKLYKNINIGYSTHILKAKINTCILAEEKLLCELKLNDKKYELIKEFFNLSQVRDSELASCYLYPNESQYARLRIVARCKYNILKEKNDKNNICKTTLIDEQCSIIYNLLLEKSESIQNDVLRSDLDFMTMLVLIDSPVIEKSFIESSHKSRLQVIDSLRLYTDIITCNELRYVLKITNSAFFFLNNPFMENYRLSLTNYFSDSLKFAVGLLDHIVTHESDYQNKIIFMYYVAYLESIIIMSIPRIRKDIYMRLEEHIIELNSEHKDELKNILNESIDRIENVYVNKTIRMRFHPKENPTKKFYK